MSGSCMAPCVACRTNFRFRSCSGMKEALDTDTRVLVMAITDNWKHDGEEVLSWHINKAASELT